MRPYYKIETVIVFYYPNTSSEVINIHMSLVDGKLTDADREYYDNWSDSGRVTISTPQMLVNLMNNHQWELTQIEPLSFYEQLDSDTRTYGDKKYRTHSVATLRYWFRRRIKP